MSGPRASLPAPLNAVPDLTGVGSKDFVESTKLRLGIHAQRRKVSETESAYQLREPSVPYGNHFGVEKDDIGPKNTYFGNDNIA